MTLSLIVAVVITAAVFYWLIRSRRKEATTSTTCTSFQKLTKAVIDDRLVGDYRILFSYGP